MVLIILKRFGMSTHNFRCPNLFPVGLLKRREHFGLRGHGVGFDYSVPLFSWALKPKRSAQYFGSTVAAGRKVIRLIEKNSPGPTPERPRRRLFLSLRNPSAFEVRWMLGSKELDRGKGFTAFQSPLPLAPALRRTSRWLPSRSGCRPDKPLLSSRRRVRERACRSRDASLGKPERMA